MICTEESMPLFGGRVFALRSIGTPTGGPFGENSMIYNEEYFSGEIGQIGTQFDGPGHIGTQVKFEDGTFHDVYYNGYTGKDMYGPNGLRKLGIEHIKPIITRGILIDIASAKNVDALQSEYIVTLSDVLQALANQGIKEEEIKEGDALFFRYGWARYWSEPATYNNNPPGIGTEVAYWIVEKKASMIG